MQLIIHIGLGKTGSSSIQHSLAANMDFLSEKGIIYLGEFFENSPVNLYDWQARSGIEQFYNADHQHESIRDLILRSMDVLSADKYSLAILSNEWLGGCSHEVQRNRGFIDAVRDLCAAGIDIKCCAYVRDHIDWSISAYQQWTLKHKTTSEIMPYSDYTLARPPLFEKTLDEWEQACTSMSIFNYNAICNVATHFWETVIGISGNQCKIFNTNRQLSACELYLRTCFNYAISSGQAVSDLVFDQYILKTMLEKLESSQKDRFSWYESLLPTATDLEVVLNRCGADIHAINTRLLANGEPPLLSDDHVVSRASSKLSSPNKDELIDYLTHLVILLAKENKQLR